MSTYSHNLKGTAAKDETFSKGHIIDYDWFCCKKNKKNMSPIQTEIVSHGDIFNNKFAWLSD